jgi:hypothetical protein
MVFTKFGKGHQLCSSQLCVDSTNVHQDLLQKIVPEEGGRNWGTTLVFYVDSIPNHIAMQTFMQVGVGGCFFASECKKFEKGHRNGGSSPMLLL